MSNASVVPSYFPTMQMYIININYAILTAGFIGNILNILVFTKLGIFRNNPSAHYFTMESIFDNIMALTYIVSQVLQRMYQADVGNLSLGWCKFRTFYIAICRPTIGFIICCEALDQFLSTHHQFRIRQKSTMKLARYFISIICCLCFIQSIPYLIYSEIKSGVGCTIINQVLLYYYTYFYNIVILGIVPILISSLWSLLAYRNVRHVVNLRIPIQRRKLDKQLTAMVFARVIVFIILLTPNTVFRVYITVLKNSSVYYVGGWYQVLSLIFEWEGSWIYSVSILFIF